MNKWDLLSLLKIQPYELKQIMRMITGQPEPQMVSTHQMIMSLVLSRSGIDPSFKAKLLIESICYQINPGTVVEDEVRYLFHLMYQQVQFATHF
jgi:hypothetical protein